MMETKAIDERRRARAEALYAEAKQTLGHAANQLRALTETARELYGETVSDLSRSRYDRDGAARADRYAARSEQARESESLAAELGQQRVELERLELAVRNLESNWLFLERPRDEAPAHERTTPADRMRILEAQEQERARLAQELHDGVAQGVSNAIFQLEVVDRAFKQAPEAGSAELQALRRMLDRELDEIRGFIHQLRPPLQTATGLDQALREQAVDVGRATGAAVEVDLSAPAHALSEAQKSVAIRVGQEALRNVRKHARAKTVSVSTRREPGSGGDDWVMEIRDDGVGFDLAEKTNNAGNRHFGLRFMRERAELVGARLEVASEPGRGTLVRLVIGPERSR